jgi:Virulence factor
MTARLSVTYWRDVPVRVSAQFGRTRHEVELPRRFQRTLELAAGRVVAPAANGWWVEDRTCTDDLELEVTAETCRLESIYSRQKLDRLAQTNGFDEYRRNRLQLVRNAS